MSQLGYNLINCQHQVAVQNGACATGCCCIQRTCVTSNVQHMLSVDVMYTQLVNTTVLLLFVLVYMLAVVSAKCNAQYRRFVRQTYRQNSLLYEARSISHV